MYGGGRRRYTKNFWVDDRYCHVGGRNIYDEPVRRPKNII
jgi:hypothetical protein